jgi:Protein of unknown function (DUF3047)
VVFDNQYLPRVIKYIWSAALPAGASFTNPLYGGRGRVIVLRSGSSGKGEWHQQTVDFTTITKDFSVKSPAKFRVSVFFPAQTLPGASSAPTMTTLSCFRNGKARRRATS